MVWVIAVAAVALIAGGVWFALRWRDPEKAPHRITPAAKRILFPFVGESVSRPALDAALRLARAEHATLVPAYIATVPMQLNIDAPLPEACEQAMPLLEAIEQRAARLEVPVDARIETGRSPRHAVQRLAEHETFDRMVIPASDARDGFSAADIAWLLQNVRGEIVVLRPAAAGAHPISAARFSQAKQGDDGAHDAGGDERLHHAAPRHQ
jgi:nucleotide-binding universal stress UspA family protein